MATPIHQFFGGIQLNTGVGSVSGGIGSPATNGLSIIGVTGTPEGAVVGYVGDMALRRDGGAGTTLYVKESGNGTNTGWVAKIIPWWILFPWMFFSWWDWVVRAG